MKYITTLATASVLYALFFFCIDSRFAADFRQYLSENHA